MEGTRRRSAINRSISGSIQTATKKGEDERRGEPRRGGETHGSRAREIPGLSEPFERKQRRISTSCRGSARCTARVLCSDYGSPLCSSSDGRNLVNTRSPLRACITHVHTGRCCRLHKARWTPPDAGGSIERVPALLRSSCHDGHDALALPFPISISISLSFWLPSVVFPRRARFPGKRRGFRRQIVDATIEDWNNVERFFSQFQACLDKTQAKQMTIPTNYCMIASARDRGEDDGGCLSVAEEHMHFRRKIKRIFHSMSMRGMTRWVRKREWTFAKQVTERRISEGWCVKRRVNLLKSSETCLAVRETLFV